MAANPHNVHDPFDQAVIQPAGERALVRELRRGDPQALATLYALYGTPIYNFVARIVGDPEDARDITQEVFVKAFRRLPDNGREMALKPWLYKVASTTCVDHLRTRKRRVETSPIGEHELPASFDLSERVEIAGLVEQTLGRMSERHRLALVLKDLHGLQHDEIGAILNISRGAAETLLHRARESFHRTFAQLSPPVEIQPTCPVARRAVITLVGRDVSPLTKRRLVEHAKDCPECRKALQLGAVGVTGLGVFLHELPLPPSLTTPPVVPLHPMAPSAPGAAAPAAATPIAASTASSGLLAKLAAVAATKVAVIAAAGAATVTVVGAGVATDRLHGGIHDRPRTPAVAATAPDEGTKTSADQSAALPAGSSHGRGWATAPGQTDAADHTRAGKDTPPGKAVSSAAKDRNAAKKDAKDKVAKDKAAKSNNSKAHAGTTTRPGSADKDTHHGNASGTHHDNNGSGTHHSNGSGTHHSNGTNHDNNGNGKDSDQTER